MTETTYYMITSPHTCINGCTGSGKSVLINNFLIELTTVYSPEQVRLILIDPKVVDYAEWKKDKHVLMHVSTEPGIYRALEAAEKHMKKAYKTLERQGLKRSDGGHIFIIIDELPTVLQSRRCADKIDSLLRLGRAANIHVITASQDSSRSTGTPARLARNFECLIGLRCRAKIASRQAIGSTGCETLPRYGYAYVICPELTTPKLIKIPFLQR